MYIHVTQLMVSTHSHHSPIVLPPKKGAIHDDPKRGEQTGAKTHVAPRPAVLKPPKPTDPMDQMDQIQARSVVYPTMTDMCRVYGHSHMLHLYTIYIYITVICIINIINIHRCFIHIYL